MVKQYPQTEFEQSSSTVSAPEMDNSLALFTTAQNETGQRRNRRRFSCGSPSPRRKLSGADLH
jgi:hypothetical protein